MCFLVCVLERNVYSGPFPTSLFYFLLTVFISELNVSWVQTPGPAPSRACAPPAELCILRFAFLMMSIFSFFEEKPLFLHFFQLY